MGYPVMFGHTY